MSDTVQVRSGNKYLDIPADAVSRYVAKGYDVVDESGKVIVKSIPNDLGILKAEYIKALETIKKLESEIAALKAAKKEVKPIVKEEPIVEEIPEAVTEVTEEVEEEPIVKSSKRRSKRND